MSGGARRFAAGALLAVVALLVLFAAPARADEGSLATLRLALWFGLLAGFGELALLAVRKYVLHRFLLVRRMRCGWPR